jgi:anti-anti-sigma regulatory factor
MAERPLQIDCRPSDDAHALAVTVQGPLVMRASSELRRVLTQALDSGVRRLEIDLSGVTEVDPAGLANLVVAARRLQASREQGGGLHIVAVSGSCADAMRRLHLFQS